MERAVKRLSRVPPDKGNKAVVESKKLQIPEGALTRHLLIKFLRKHLPQVLEDDSHEPPRMTNTFEYPYDMDPVARLMFENHAALAVLYEETGKPSLASTYKRKAMARIAPFRKEHRAHCQG